ncbi:hypothetical protein [Phaffia rhodozyma]|uniref:Uncharacterized protein n=1 Tax=Phaffia rhodozyma TaxID=264483 RepID=A0A0F7SXD9_PHARH|nr:hypothetical protein [Phaffia rhodozyma]
MLRSASTVRSVLRTAPSSPSCLLPNASFSSSSFSLSTPPFDTPVPTQGTGSSSADMFSSSSRWAASSSSTTLNNTTDTLAEPPSSALSSVDANGDPTSFDEIAQLLRTILQKEDPTWEENRSIHLPYGRRFKAVMRDLSGTVFKGTELSDLIVRLAFIKALKARFGSLETIHFGMDPNSTAFPPIAGHECSFTVLNEPVGSMPTLNETTGQKGFRLRGTLPAYFHSSPVGGPSFIDLIKLSAPVQPDFHLPNLFEPNEDEHEPYNNRLGDQEANESDQPIPTDYSSLNSSHSTNLSTANDCTPLTAFTIEVYPDHDWSPAEILLPDQTFSIGYPEITRSSVAYLEKWERDLWIKGFRHFEGFTGGLRQARESAASRLNLDLEKEAQAARYHDEQRRAGEIPSRVSVDQSDLEGDIATKGIEETNAQSQKRGKRSSSSDPAPRASSPPQPLQPPHPSALPVAKTTLDRSLPPHLAKQALSPPEAASPILSSLPLLLAESSSASSASKSEQTSSLTSKPTLMPTEPSVSSPSLVLDPYPSSSVEASTPISLAHPEGTPEIESPSTTYHWDSASKHTSEPSTLFANLRGLLFGKH